MTRLRGTDLADWNRRVWIEGDKRAPVGPGGPVRRTPGVGRPIGIPTRRERGRLIDPDRCTDNA